MTRLFHDNLDITTHIAREDGKTLEIGRLSGPGIHDLEWGRRFTELFGVDLVTGIRSDIPLGPAVNFTDERAISKFDFVEFMCSISISDNAHEVPEWTIVIKDETSPQAGNCLIAVLELSGSVDTPEVISALLELGFVEEAKE